MADKGWAVFFLPAVTLGLLLLMRVTMTKSFLQKYGDASETHYFIINAVMLFMGFIHTVTLLVALNPDLEIPRAIAVGIGALFAFLGNVMGRLRPNPFFGFRMSWTMNDEEVWRRTHRAGGRWMLISGVAIMLTSLVLPPVLIFVVMMALIFGSTAWTIYYSRQLWLERHPTAS
jgi:uncharacterized membrane protein